MDNSYKNSDVHVLFVYSSSFRRMTNRAQIDHNDKSVDGVHGTRTRGVRILVDADVLFLCMDFSQYCAFISVLLRLLFIQLPSIPRLSLFNQHNIYWKLTRVRFELWLPSSLVHYTSAVFSFVLSHSFSFPFLSLSLSLSHFLYFFVVQTLDLVVVS